MSGTGCSTRFRPISKNCLELIGVWMIGRSLDLNVLSGFLIVGRSTMNSSPQNISQKTAERQSQL
jgi:hypothetical protein